MRDYLLLLLVLGLVPFMIYRAWIGALAWTWIGLMNPHLYTWTLRNFPFALVIGVGFLVGWLIAKDKRRFPVTPATISLLLLYLFITLKTPFAWKPEVATYYWTQYSKVVLGAILISTIVYSATRVRWLLWTMLVSLGVAYGVKGGLFSLATGGQTAVQGPEPSFIGGNTHLAVALIMVAPVYLAVARDTDWMWLKRGAYAAFGLTLIAILFSYSRGAWLGLAAMAPFLFLQAKRKFLIVLALIPISIGALAFIPDKIFARAETIQTYGEDLSALQRLQGWGVAFNVASSHPLGAGFVLDATPVEKWMSYANFEHPRFKRANAAHSIYFQLLGDHGFGGLALFLATLLTTMASLRATAAAARRTPGNEWLGHYANALLIGLIGYSVSGAFVSLGYFDLFYLFVIMSAILARELQPVPETQAAAPARKPAKRGVRISPEPGMASGSTAGHRHRSQGG